MGRGSLLRALVARLFRRRAGGREGGLVEAQKRRLLTLFLVLFFAALVGSLAGHQYEFGVGERSGRLVKLSREGVFFKTWEGELRVSESSAQTWSFTVPAEPLARELRERMGADLTLHYSKRLVGLPWVGDSAYLVDGVR